MYSLEEFRTNLTNIKKLTTAEKKVVDALLEFENADSLRKKFLPPYLHSIVADENAGWREKFSKSKNCLSLALRLFSQGNSLFFLLIVGTHKYYLN
jgi:hypothetical protein